SGPSLGMALDESPPNDEVIEDRGVIFMVEKDLLYTVKPHAVEFITTPRGGGFKLTSGLGQEGACGSCTSC
ncbi:MAG: IscA/HesB family protein, partial [Syntrophales bacterium]|nr:IscA/HesB family protein [Syntrophales bacterium]